MRIDLQIIDHKKQRYTTTGDWWFEEGVNAGTLEPETVLRVRVSRYGNEAFEMLTGQHETDEAILCVKDGVTGEMVDAFDKDFEHHREHSKIEGGRFWFRGKLFDKDAEPGDCILAPYYKQHQIAEGMTRIRASLYGVDWNAYEEADLALYR